MYRKILSANRLLNDYFRLYPTAFYRKDEIILQVTEPRVEIFYVEDGFVRFYLPREDGRELSVHICKPGDIFPPPFVLNKPAGIFNYAALKGTHVRVVPSDDYMAFMREHPAALYAVSDLTSSMLTSILGYIELISTENVHRKTVLLLLHLVRIFGLEQKKMNIEIPIQLNHSDLAAWMNTSRETATRHMLTLRSEGFLAYSHSMITITDMARLKSLIGL